jgi:orotate phosphoribosyltransferase
LNLGLHRAARRSTYTLNNGAHSDVYFDVTSYLMGLRDSEEYEVDLARERSGSELNDIVEKLRSICEANEIGRIAFIEPNSGEAIGILPAVTTFLSRIDLPSCVVRPRKRLKIERILGAPISSGEEILLVSDVATTGRTLIEAARVLQAARGRVAHAFVIYDRGETACERLAEAGIQLHAPASPSLYEKAVQQSIASRN